MSLNEPIVEDATLEWFRLRPAPARHVRELVDAVGHGPQLAPDKLASERGSFGGVVLVERSRDALRNQTREGHLMKS